MASPAGYRNDTPASRRDATGIQWYSVDRLQTDGQGPLHSRFPSTLSQNKGRVVWWQHGVEAHSVLSLTVREGERRDQRRQHSARVKLKTTTGPAWTGWDCGKWHRARKGGESRQGSPLFSAVRGRG
ncbi:hypothetical protein DHEL01_v209637 [Diaporthe helianthi]|uniref:Uncharacterized protein n=1 Tax=Diaporthe helianthi TaxID=158607 RepID=A0A2P5HP04_DIAHE|nr:hypothetical protein DHEL01_v209637 [Diaporthe helianthi]